MALSLQSLQHTQKDLMYQQFPEPSLTQPQHLPQSALGIQQDLRVYSYGQIRIFPLDNTLLSMSLQKIRTQYIRSKLSYSTRIHLYKLPLCSHHKISYLPSQTPLSTIISHLGPICFTFNNTQYFEQPDYQNTPIYSVPPSKTTIETVIQICQANSFVHENYRVQEETRVGFFRDTCARYGRNIFVRYGNLRVQLTEFGGDSVVKDTIGRFVDGMGRLTITVDSVDIRDRGDGRERRNVNGQVELWKYLQKVSKKTKINLKLYFRLYVHDENIKEGQEYGDEFYVISRECKPEHLKYLLEVIYKQKIELYSPEKQKLQQISPKQMTQVDQLRAIIKKSHKTLLTLPTPIPNCQILGSVGSLPSNTLQLLVLQNSSLLHRLSLTSCPLALHRVSLTLLPCIPTNNLDEELFFLKDGELVSYSISIDMVKVKYYGDEGQLLCLRVFPWYQEIYEIEFVVVDMFCVRLKNDKRKVRVFYIWDPEEWVEVAVCEKFFPARLGNNVYSDGSGLFATANQWTDSVEIFQVSNKSRLGEVRLKNYKSLTNVFFTQENQQKQRRIILNFGNKQLSLYSFPSMQPLINVLCQKGMNNFISLGQDIYACTGTEMRKLIFSQDKGQKKQKEKIVQWAESQHVPDKCAIIVPQSEGKVVVKDQVLTFASLSKFWIFNMR